MQKGGDINLPFFNKHLNVVLKAKCIFIIHHHLPKKIK